MSALYLIHQGATLRKEQEQFVVEEPKQKIKAGGLLVRAVEAALSRASAYQGS